ncbi:zinc/manganese transport system substrate-binding protein [Ilumatobacter fluminis]|uniref:Zinc/manganese transport system substrate-binding protein n=1 Tax=Ilumatobacter fluminis TaxID=467091 RepID=A0A4R7I2W0_9ACTN|nr:metal ABC transporter substrate-binding protein [Ilumatobacter fluminis]TDT17957.1 zinc/manganese transport system substrate-binding protein [Ilumatobacter fluminis]
MRKLMTKANVAIVASAGLVLAACGSDDDTADEPAAETETSDDAAADTAATDEPADQASGELPTIVVTTNILGDVVSNAVGDAAEVVTIMPVGADPHSFQASAQEIDVLMSADALIVNGGSLEESLLDVIESAEADGVPTFEALSAVETIEFGEGAHDEDEDHAHDEDEDHAHDEDEDHAHDEDEDHAHDEDEDHAHDEDEEGHDDHDHDHSGDDPHFWTDPMRMAAAVDGIVVFLQETVEFADPAAVDASAEAYVAELTALNDEIEALVAEVPEDGRKLVTNHEAYGYFADAYGFEQIGAVVPSGSTVDGTSGGELAELVELVEAEGVPAVFSDNTASDELIQVLAEEAGGVEVVELLSGSLTEPGTEGDNYLDMQRVNAERISGALS